MYRVLLVGCGSLGFRYLQGLTSVDLILDITIVDPLDSSLTRAKDLINNKNGVKFQNAFRVFKNFDLIHGEYDLAIVSTSADVRSTVVQIISKYSAVRYWIFEKVLAQSVDQIDLIQNCARLSDKSWVNTSRRSMEWHKKIKSELNQKIILLERIGSDWGMACNSIHFIDYLAWLSDEKVIEVNISNSESKWFKSKRAGFYEVLGEIEVLYSQGSKAILSCKANAEDQGIIIHSNNDRWVICESGGVASQMDKVIYGELENQSAMTKGLVERILLNGDCELTSLSESSKMHKLFINALLSHWNALNARNDKVIPIT